jgi:predicted MPP superfamily phosphohydrolase
MILYYAFDREMLNAVGFGEADRTSRNAIEKAIEYELKCLIFTMPLDECVVISPSFRFESEICQRILVRNRAFTDNSTIIEYRRENNPKDFWLKKNTTYRHAMDISEVYRRAYGENKTYTEISSLWMGHAPKTEITGIVSRDVFMETVRQRGEKFLVSPEQVEDVLKVTDETREDTFLWEVEEHMLHQYGISDDVIRRLGIREAMNKSYINVFANQGVKVCRPGLGLPGIEDADPAYDMQRIKSALERLGIFERLISLSAQEILNVRRNPELQNMLDVLRRKLAEGKSASDIYKAVNKVGDMASLMAKLALHTIGGKGMDTTTRESVLQKNTLRLLHLSDLHLCDEDSMKKHYFHLKLDLKKNFEIEKLDYLIISGDVSDRPVESMYQTAVTFVKNLIAEFEVPAGHVILIPGNHDCDREVSKECYGKKGTAVTDQKKYNDRYLKYSQNFYQPIIGRPYPMEPEKQFEDYIFEEDNLCFLGLNSCWQIDHCNTDRSSICMEAVMESGTIWCDAKDYAKIAVWHHPLSGEGAIKETTFMETLANAGFRACFHGHVHEAKNELFSYDAARNIRMVGAGTFGAVREERGDGIPRQYNMIEFDKEKRLLTVHTRKREKDGGAWQADARWEDRNHAPKSYYEVDCAGEAGQ